MHVDPRNDDLDVTVNGDYDIERARSELRVLETVYRRETGNGA